MQSLVDEINLVSSKLRELSSRGLNGAESGPLVGDTIVKNLITQIQSITTDPIYGYGDDALYMASFGIQTKRDGSLELDTDKFTNTFNNDPDSFLAIVQDRVSSSTSSISGYTIGTDWEAGVYSLSVDASDNATIEGVAMSVSSGLYYSSSGDTTGLYLDVNGDVSSASIYLGRSVVSSLTELISSYLISNSEIDNRISNYNDNVTELQDQLLALDEKMVSLRERYTEKYSALNRVMQSVKSTQTSLDNMIDSWKGLMNQ
jgi:flagellar hook-associated protein 2